MYLYQKNIYIKFGKIDKAELAENLIFDRADSVFVQQHVGFVPR